MGKGKGRAVKLKGGCILEDILVAIFICLFMVQRYGTDMVVNSFAANGRTRKVFLVCQRQVTWPLEFKRRLERDIERRSERIKLDEDVDGDFSWALEQVGILVLDSSEIGDDRLASRRIYEVLIMYAAKFTVNQDLKYSTHHRVRLIMNEPSYVMFLTKLKKLIQSMALFGTSNLAATPFMS
ncbi:hypothetical protein CCACVL1_20099 [Corchorus capsularis]|uniref:Uncharacterized protein n=1 Tax=Corchorus capsularis TaxID=210143 RepID=A0A1R3HCM1_COCAP|nr:hypothetical protein CCACVL1_20099 [Corchorus capsularis]